jgi:hypothetical protein
MSHSVVLYRTVVSKHRLNGLNRDAANCVTFGKKSHEDKKKKRFRLLCNGFFQVVKYGREWHFTNTYLWCIFMVWYLSADGLYIFAWLTRFESKVISGLDSLITTTWRRMGEWRYSSTIIDFSTRWGSEWSASRLCCFTPWETVPRAHYIEGSVVLRARLKVMENNLLHLPGIETRLIGRPASSLIALLTELFRLR